MNIKPVCILPVLVAVSTISASVVTADPAITTGPLVTFGVPRSNNVIVAEIKSPNTGVIHHVESRDGTMVTFWKKGDPFAIAFLTSLVDGQPRYDPYRITFNADGIENASQIRLFDESRRSIHFGKAVQFKFDRLASPFKVRSLEAFEGYFPGRPPIEYILDMDGQAPRDVMGSLQIQSHFGETDGAICCVECRGEVVCASGGLLNQCGSCNSGFMAY